MGRLSVKQITTIAVLLILSGLLILTYNFFEAKKSAAYDNVNKEILEIDDIREEEKEEENEVSEPEEEKKEEVEEEKKQTIYVGKLEIPKIGFSRGFCDKNDKDNNVDINIQVMKQSSMPDVANGNFIVIGHSGNAWYSFFKDLYKLQKGDEAFVYYNDKKYTYKIDTISYVPKTGTVKIERDKTKSTMTLITCTKNDKTKQTVYILYLTSVDNI